VSETVEIIEDVVASFRDSRAALTAENRRMEAELEQLEIAARSRFAVLVEREREYQRAKWGENENVHSWPEWGSILGEEFGEVCRALKQVHWEGAPDTGGGRHGLRGELVQLAAICAAMIERIEVGT